ncbi:hypothetical protein BH09BAC2_BH09BAC2_13470 [soil metagenome]
MKKTFLLIIYFCITANTFAAHISGGELFYKYLGPGSAPNTNKYQLTLRIFRDCSADGPNVAPMPASLYISLFDNTNDARLSDNLISRSFSNDSRIEKQDYSCINSRPEVCYDIGYYILQVDLPINAKGYTASFQTCCRVGGINNILNNFNSQNGAPGVTYVARISGTDLLGPTEKNSSPTFKIKDTALVCAGNYFTLDFGAVDTDGPNGDSLSYSFCSAYGSDPSITDASTVPGGGLSGGEFPFLQYNTTPGYSGTQPMGPPVTINPLTGLISGIAPATTGRYVINVCITEWRNGKIVGYHRKDFNVKTAACNTLTAALNPGYITCNGYDLTFSNLGTSTSGSLFFWDFGDPNSGAANTSTDPNPLHTYSDTGIFKLKLKISTAAGCTDSATSLVKVYPGFFPAATYSGKCKNTPIQFTDLSTTKYGVINSWSWNFGDPSTNADTSHLKNPVYTYTTAANYSATLTVTSNKGCIGSIPLPVSITDKPELSTTNDTLICVIDTLQLNAIGTGTFFWTPAYNINNQNTASPLVSPKVPTTYYVTLTDPFGCSAVDSVFVDVTPQVTIKVSNDTTICLSDTVRLNTISNALKFQWNPSIYLSSDTSRSTLTAPLTDITYVVTGTVGSCKAKDSVKIKTVPYPNAKAFPDTAICLGSSAQLFATGGSIYRWSPSFFLNNANIPNPVASPDRTIRYIVTVTDVLGCPKPKYDTADISVFRVIADAEPRDTSVVVNQPLQLHATGGVLYVWTPVTGLNDPNIADPIAMITKDIQYVVKVSNNIGCFARDTINVRVYDVIPGLYVPNAFTPDGDGRNDIFKPIAVGIKQINYFRVYNRWGQLVFLTNQINKGWDGTFKGKPQDAAAYVWMVEGVDYTGRVINQKGSVVLIR